ncbi:MAG: deoxynucleoside kinase [Cellvibrionaceae bacterium]
MTTEPSPLQPEPQHQGARLDLTDKNIPGYIAVEGPIGAGKTTLAKRLAQTFNYNTLLEQAEDNPFLERFYQDPKSSALPTQLHFLFQRAKQIQELRQGDMFQPVRIADFLMAKDQLFAQTILDDDELHLYQQVYNQLTIDAPTPDLVIYLQAPVNVLQDRIHRRGIPMEQQIRDDYLQRLHEAYTRFFLYYDQSPLLIINAEKIDWINNPQDYANLVDVILDTKPGRHFYNPSSDINF